MSGTGVISFDELCVAAETILKVALPQVLELPEVKTYLGDAARTYRDIKTWQQLPTIEAISAATLPVIAISTPGLVSAPRYVRSRGVWEATVRLGVGIYDREPSADHSATQAKVRNWVAFLRTALLRNPTLGGVAEGLTWTGEEYDLVPARNQARTFGAGAVFVDVRVDVPDTFGLGLPPVTSTHTQLSVT